MQNAPNALFQHLNLQPPATLYHYTSMDVLISLLETGRFWSSNLRYLNDSSEMKHVLGLINDRISVLTNKLSMVGHSGVALLKKRLEDATKDDVFIACFSENEDDLSQWRGYAPSGCGVCIGFRSNALHKAADVDISRPPVERNRTFSFLAKVIYLAGASGPAFDPIIEASITEEPDDPVAPSSMLAIAAPFYKNSSFRGECEWRIVTHSPLNMRNPSALRYRVGKSTLIPYMEIDLRSCDENFISEVIVGPSPNIDLSVEAVQQMMDGKMKKVAVRPSEIPYRHW